MQILVSYATHRCVGLPLLAFSCNGAKVSDLTPLRGMRLQSLDCGQSPIADLTPLKEMKLTSLFIHQTLVSDLSSLQGMPLVTLAIAFTPVSDLSVLLDCKTLQLLNAGSTKVTAAQIAALQKALPNCKIEWDDPSKATTPQPATSGTK